VVKTDEATVSTPVLLAIVADAVPSLALMFVTSRLVVSTVVALTVVMLPVVAVAVVNVPAAAETPPMTVPLIVPPVMVAPELERVFSVAVDDAVKVVKAPLEAVVAPTVVPSIVPPEIATLPIAKVFVMSDTAAPTPPPFVNTTREVLGAMLTVAPEPCDKITVCAVLLRTKYSFCAVFGSIETVFVPLGVPVNTSTAN